jgi:hypothetical protein
MASKGKSQKILGVIAFASTALFMLESRKSPDNKKIEGLNIDIDPEKMVDSIKANISKNPKVNDILADLAKSSIARLLG